jgi:uncharacterized membrane protein YjjP (DUF1212 family)
MSGDDRIAYVLKLARAMHGYGYAANRLEEVLGATAHRLELEAQFFSTPTSIFAAFGAEADQRTFLLRVEPGDTDLGRLADVDRVTLHVARGDLTPAQGAEALDGIADAPPLYGGALTVLAFGAASAAAARFLAGGPIEIALAGALGIVTGVLALAAARWATLARIFEPLTAFAATLIATAFAARVAPVSVLVTVLAGLIVLVPGLTLTTAMTELATRHLASGTARMSSALLLFVTMTFGVALGGEVARLLFGTPPAVDPARLPGWTELVALAVAPLGFVVLLRARMADAGWILAAGWIAFGATRAGAVLLGAELGAFVGALAVGVAANLYAWVRDRPSQVLLVPGVLLLVPGSVGFRSASALLERQVVSGIETAFTMFLVASGIVAGLLLANVIVPKRRTELPAVAV